MTTKQVSKTPEEATIELNIRMQHVLETVEKIQETLEGTLRTRGLRDRVLLAEEDIKRNREAYDKVMTLIETKTKELSEQIGGVSKKEGETSGIIAKWRPYIDALTWVITGAAGILLMMLLTGQLHLVR